MRTVAWPVAKHPELKERNLRRWAHMLGFGGHFLTKSRRYSTTFGHVRENRAKHARDTAREIDGVPEPDGDTVIVINHWRYAGSSKLLVAALWEPVGEDCDGPGPSRTLYRC